jgi:hypothetical protein
MEVNLRDQERSMMIMKRDEGYNEPGEKPDYCKDTRIPFGLYGISYSPADGSIWGSSLPHPGYIVRIAPGSNPPDTALAEVYKVPLPGCGIRHGCRSQWRRLGAARLRPYRQFRAAQMRTTERTRRGERRKMSGGVDVLSAPRPSTSGRFRRRGEPLLPLG